MVIEPEGTNLLDLSDGVIITDTSLTGFLDSSLHITLRGMPFSLRHVYADEAVFWQVEQSANYGALAELRVVVPIC